MSVQVMAWVMNHAPADLTGTEQSVAIALANYASDEGGQAYPSVKKLSDITHWNERTVQRALHILVDKGVIEIEREATHDTPAVYCFPLYRGDAATPRRGDRNTPHGAAESHPWGDASTPVGVTESPPRGDTQSGRGVPKSPKPSLTVIEPSVTPLYPPKSTRDGRKTRWQEEWQLPDEWRGIAEDAGESADLQFEKFRLYWLGTGKAMADWRATWQRWIRQAPEMRSGGKGKTSSDVPRHLRPNTPEWAAATGKAVM